MSPLAPTHWPVAIGPIAKNYSRHWLLGVRTLRTCVQIRRRFALAALGRIPTLFPRWRRLELKRSIQQRSLPRDCDVRISSGDSQCSEDPRAPVHYEGNAEY